MYIAQKKETKLAIVICFAIGKFVILIAKIFDL